MMVGCGNHNGAEASTGATFRSAVMAKSHDVTYSALVV